MLKIGELFREEPPEDVWELRGDRLLWQELGRALAFRLVPESGLELERILEEAFWEATGHSLSFCNQVLVDRFAENGQSRGGISGASWRYRLFPIVVERYEKHRASIPA
ncbi:hypothetical protein CLV78_104308 [Aliiruegeria haliotis]|uniref:Uncharacterized protein n=1 Tax=Aliiruegeria haliotis TaxID=1280846 RepID=A0A2T0RRI4_9RHOB|nr:hypothetical protein [Aliiruegeria haliotis]PRY23815.1 hypothetical protein CLV78_104308 [Aliiruegeria haliotis]